MLGISWDVMGDSVESLAACRRGDAASPPKSSLCGEKVVTLIRNLYGGGVKSSSAL